jgi:hypothetical protein
MPSSTSASEPAGGGAVLQKALLGLIAVLLCLPVPAMLILRTQPVLPPWLYWAGNRTLAGITVQRESPALSWDAWFDGKYQEGATRWLSENFAGRELLIRLNNQLLWSVFGKSYMMQEMIIQGRHNDLFSSDYIAFREGFAAPASQGYIDEIAAKAALLQHRLATGGTAFAVLLTPDKPSFYPQDLPARYQPRVPGSPQPPPVVDRLIAALARAGANYVDGRAVTQQVAAKDPWRTFPRTGVHWNRLTASATAEALLRSLEKSSGRPFPNLLATNIRSTLLPDAADADLATLLNLMWMPHETYVKADYSCREPSPGTLTIVGGSFANALDSIYDESGAFAQINHYHYFKIDVQRFPANETEHVDEAHVPWERDFLSAQAVVLEINPQYVTGRHPLAFLNAALAAGPRAAAAVSPPVAVVFDPASWYGEERAGVESWHWAKGPATVLLINAGNAPQPVHVTYALSAVTNRTVRLVGLDGEVLDARPVSAFQRTTGVSLWLTLAPGRSKLRFESDQPPQTLSPGTDPRKLDVQVFDFQVDAAH